jgi:hypothetical protein
MFMYPFFVDLKQNSAKLFWQERIFLNRSGRTEGGKGTSNDKNN